MVDIIHTDGYDSAFDPEDWLSPVNHYGTLIPLGKIDFYPNYGYSQPGAGIFTIAGSHHRAIELFLWSITNPGKLSTNTVLVGRPEFEQPVKDVKYVVECVEMGYHFDGKCEGLFYIQTASQEPWKSSHKHQSTEPELPTTDNVSTANSGDGEQEGYFSTAASYCSIV